MTVDDADSIARAHEKIEPVGEITAGHANRLIAQGCPPDIAWQMAADLHRVFMETQITGLQIKVAIAQAMAVRGSTPQ